MVVTTTNTNHQCRGRGSNPGHLRDKPTLYHVALKAGLNRKAVQVYHIPITTTYSPSSFRFVRDSQFEQPLNTRPTSLSGHQAYRATKPLGLPSLSGHQASRATMPMRRGYLLWVPDVTGEKVFSSDRYMIHLYCLAVQAGFYSDAVDCWPVTQAVRVRSPAAALVIRIFSPVTFVVVTNFFTCYTKIPE